MKKRKKINKKHRTIVALLILLLIVFGLLLASNLFSHDTNSYFARIRVAIKKKVQIVYNYNLFDGSKIDNSGIKEYDSDKQVITFDGKLEGKNINLCKLNVKLKKGERYRVTVNYLSGSYDKNGELKFIFELQKNGDYYTDRKNGTHYITGTLPTKKDKPIDKVLPIKDKVLDATNILYRLYQENEVEFKNYKIQISITKLESKIGVAGDKYGKLPIPEKDGYEFLGWYDSISGGKKITETNTILKKYNHPLYAHWKKSIHPYRTVNYDGFVWNKYTQKDSPLVSYYSNHVPYYIYAPKDIKDLNNVSLPLIVWLHGGGELADRGGTIDQILLTGSGLPHIIKTWEQYNLETIPALVVAPHHILPSTGGWAQTRNLETIKALIKYAHDTYNIDKNRVVLVGHSYGGNGVFFVSNSMKKYFSAVVALSPTLSKYSGYGFDKEYFANLKMRSYSEFSENKIFFDWVGTPEKYIKMNVHHSKVPIVAFTEDKNNNKVSDLVEWLFYDE
jgi:uncharacterized repeat protein (TIGR02543 family)